MKLREVFRYELEHRVRSVSTWVYPVFLLLVAMWMYLATADGSSAAALANAPERLAGAAVLPGMFGMLISAALFGDAAARDIQAGMDPLIYTSPLRKADYLGGRFLAALVVNALILIVIPIGALIATTMAGSFDPEAVGPFRAGPYLQSYFIFLLPNLVVVGAILFAIAVLARQIVPVYLGTVAIFIGYVVALNYGTGIEAPMLATLVDPLGLVSLQQATRYWTEAERNTRLVGLEPAVLLNRAVWLAVAAGVLAVLASRFRFAHVDGGRRRRLNPVEAGTVKAEPPPADDRRSEHTVSVPRVAGSFGFRTRLRQTLAVARYSVAEAASSRWFLVILLGCAGVTLLMGWNVGDTVFDTATWPRTLLVAETVQSRRIAPIIYLLIVVLAGELVWKDRETRAAEIADAVPLPESVALLGRFMALVAIIVMIQLAAMAGGILIQALQGYYEFEIGLYIRILLGMKLADYLLFAALAVAVHVAVNHKYLGHLVVLLLFAATKALPALGVVGHHLLLYGSDPGWTYSDMNRFGPFLEPFVWFKLYWAAWALLLGVAAALLWVRGPELGVRNRIGAARARLGGGVLRAAGVAVVLILGLGGFVFYNTNVLNEYRPPAETGAPLAEYERRYSRFADLPQPTITGAELRIEIYPDQPAVDLWGTYRLVNMTEVPVDSVHVYLDPDVEPHRISIDGAAAPVLADDEVGYRIYVLKRPLQPGDSLQLTFDVAFRPQGFRNGDIQTGVVANGAYFNRSWMPVIGYQRMFELADEDAREHFGLAPRIAARSPEEPGERLRRQPFTDADLVHVDAVIGTAADQIAVTPGALRRSWTENGRRYFHYVTGNPVPFGASVFSANYAVLEDSWTPASGSAGPVALRVFHHAAHAGNLDRMVSGMKASLDYFTAEFGPYPYGQLRIVETPRYGGFGHAHPETIGFTEDVFFARPKPGEFDQTFYGTAHEVAHTWWGGEVRGADGVRGQRLLSESLANYGAMMVTEKTWGLEAARQVYAYQMNRYLTMRGITSRDVPLVQVEDQAYIFYGKGAVAMYLLRDYIGERRVNAALRNLLEKHGAGLPPYPTSLDLYAELQAVTPDSLQYLLTDLFETVTLWDVSATRAESEPAGAGGYTVTLEVDARKMRADSAGNETPAEMNDLIEIGVFARDSAGGGAAPGEPIYLEKHRIRSGRQTITITVPREPARAGIDPYRKLIDRDGGNNVVEVRAAG